MEIRKLTEAEMPAALELAWRGFRIFEASEYAPEGVETFRVYVQDLATAKYLTVYGAFEGGDDGGRLGSPDRRAAHLPVFHGRRLAPAGDRKGAIPMFPDGQYSGNGDRECPPMRWRSTVAWNSVLPPRSGLLTASAIRQ